MNQKNVDEIKDFLIGYEEADIAEAFTQLGIIDLKTGELTDFWLNLVDTDLLVKRQEFFSAISDYLYRRVGI